MTEVILVRHGQTDWNVTGRFRGRADIPLNERGRREATATAERVAREWQPAAIYGSPVHRAQVTAARIANQTWLELHEDPRLSDVDYGEWQGLTRTEVAARFPSELALFESTPSLLRIPGGEGFTSVRERVAAFLLDIEEKHPNDTIVVVGHTEVNRILLLITLQLPTDALWRIEQHPCAISVLRAAAQRWTIVTMNDTCHLAALG
jgi:broad specificity phosphatase PhoE